MAALAGKVIIITGASKGLGVSMAEECAREGARVVLAARSEEKLKKAEAELPGSLMVRADLREPGDIEALVLKTMERFGRIDILVNNAGQGIYGPFEKIDIKKAFSKNRPRQSRGGFWLA